jgi:hypothetical protein
MIVQWRARGQNFSKVAKCNTPKIHKKRSHCRTKTALMKISILLLLPSTQTSYIRPVAASVAFSNANMNRASGNRTRTLKNDL